jgi:hypothetical protein
MFWLVVVSCVLLLLVGAYWWDRTQRRRGRDGSPTLPHDEPGGHGRPPWQDYGG